MRELTKLELALVAGGSSGSSGITVTAPVQYYPDFSSGDGAPASGGSDGSGGGGGSGDSGAPDPNKGCGGVLAPDTGFISEREGGSATHGYVPRSGQSGVTIGTGVDLGQHSLADIRSAIDRVYSQYPVNNAYPNFERTRQQVYQTINSLQPYMGLQGQDAVDMLAARPLTVSTAFANVLDIGIQADMHDTVVANFDRDSDYQFVNLPPNVQTVILDVAHQYGTDLARRTPNFWSQVTRGDWNAAYNNLMNFGDDYSTRRQLEAGLLKQAIDAGIPGPSDC